MILTPKGNPAPIPTEKPREPEIAKTPKGELPQGMQATFNRIIESGVGNGSVSSMLASGKKKEKKRDNSDALVLRLPKGERTAFKVFCAQHQVAMTDFIYACMDFVRTNEEDGILKVSKGGIRFLKKLQ